jgi:hypothetical protein
MKLLYKLENLALFWWVSVLRIISLDPKSWYEILAPNFALWGYKDLLVHNSDFQEIMTSILYGHMQLSHTSIGPQEWGIDPPTLWLVVDRLLIVLTSRLGFEGPAQLEIFHWIIVTTLF